MLDNDTSNSEKTSEAELFDDIDNEYLKRLLNHKLLRFFRQNTTTKIALATAIITTGSFFIKVLSYMRLKGYLSFFSISVDSVGYTSNHGFAEFLINGITFIGLAIAVSLAYIIIEFFVNQHELRKIRHSITVGTFFKKVELLFSDIKSSALLFLAALFFIELINLLLWTYMASGKSIFTYTIIEWSASLLVFTIIEIITAVLILFFRSVKNKKLIKEKKRTESLTQAEREIEEIKKKVMSSQKSPFIDIITSSAVLLFFLYSTGAYLFGAFSAQQKKTFPIIEDSYTVVYQDQQHYWVIASQEQDDVLLLNTLNQKILDINGIEVMIRSYDEIVIENK